MDAPLFPRGSGGTDRRRGRTEAVQAKSNNGSSKRSRDDLFGERPPSSARPSKKRPLSSSSGSSSSSPSSSSRRMESGAISFPPKERPPVSLALSSLGQGTTLLGVVRAEGFSDRRCAVSLPGRLTGYLTVEEDDGDGDGDAVDTTPLSQRLRPGQMMAFAVKGKPRWGSAILLGTEKNNRVELSAEPKDVNAGITIDKCCLEGTVLRGRIASREDHGCLVDLGLTSDLPVTAFLAYDNVPSSRTNEWTVGRYVDVVARVSSSPTTSTPTPTLASHKKKTKPKTSPAPAAVAQSRLLLRLSLVDPSTKAVSKGSSPLVTMKALVSHTMASLKPGMLVECKADDDGATHHPPARAPRTTPPRLRWVTFFDVFVGHVDVGIHSVSTENGVARIVAVDPSRKVVRLSVLPHILRMELPALAKAIKATQTLTCRVVRVEGPTGVLLAHDQDDNNKDADTTKEQGNDVQDQDSSEEEDDQSMESDGSGDESDMDEDNDTPLDQDHKINTKAKGTKKGTKDTTHKDSFPSPLGGVLDSSSVGIFVTSARVTDGSSKVSEDFLKKTFLFPDQKQQKFVEVKVLSTTQWIMDGLWTGSTAPSTLAAHVLEHADLVPGRLYQSSKIVSTLENGVLVELGSSDSSVRAVCPALHLSDVTTTTTTSDYRRKADAIRFAVGKRIDVRVLSVQPEKRRAYVTHKKWLLSEPHPLVSWEEARQLVFSPSSTFSSAHKRMGFVTKIDSRQVMVTFFGNVFGRVTAKYLTERGVTDPSETYRIGQVLECRLIPQKKTLVNPTDNDGNGNGNGWFDLKLSLDLSEEADKRDRCRLSPPKIVVEVGTLVSKVKVLKCMEFGEEEGEGGGRKGYAEVLVESCAQKEIGSFEATIPYEQVEDEYKKDGEDVSTDLMKKAKAILVEGTTLDRQAIVLESSSSTSSKLPVLSLRPLFVKAASAKESSSSSNGESHNHNQTFHKKGKVILPMCVQDIYVGANLMGYVTRVDPRYGSFLRFPGGITGIFPKTLMVMNKKKKKPSSSSSQDDDDNNSNNNNNQTEEFPPLFSTQVCTVMATDGSTDPPRLILKESRHGLLRTRTTDDDQGATTAPEMTIQPGDDVGDVIVENVGFYRATVTLKRPFPGRARIHVTMADTVSTETDTEPLLSSDKTDDGQKINLSEHHPFHGWKEGTVISNVRCVAVELFHNVWHLDLTNRSGPPPPHAKTLEHLLSALSQQPPTQRKLRGVVTTVLPSHKGVIVHLCPGVSVTVPILQLSESPEVLNHLSKGRCVDLWHRRGKFTALSPEHNKFTTARVTSLKSTEARLELADGRMAKCCITELQEPDRWVNLPLGRKSRHGKKDGHEKDANEEEETHGASLERGSYVKCRVFPGQDDKKKIKKQKKDDTVVEVSLRQSRIDGNFDDDKVPSPKALVWAYVQSTDAKGCFVRLSRSLQGRILLKELSDEFLVDPPKQFPPGRLVRCRVVSVNKKRGIDLTARESLVFGRKEEEGRGGTQVGLSDLTPGTNHTGTVTRVEPYGVFVRLDSDVVGMAHRTECTDVDVAVADDLEKQYGPGDPVKVHILNVDMETRRLSLSLKPSRFVDDDDDDDDDNDDDSIEEKDEESEEDEALVQNIADRIEKSDSEDEQVETLVSNSKDGQLDDDHDDDNDSSSDSESSDEEDKDVMDTNVGFQWDVDASNDALHKHQHSDEEDDDDDKDFKDGGNKKRKRGRDEEKNLYKKEKELADGIGEETPQTVDDFERLVTQHPDESQHWIKYMAYRLSLGDIDGSRTIAERALEKLNFRRETEGEKLNVWTALLALEVRQCASGNHSNQSILLDTLDKACAHNNPKQVYLRSCEILERQVEQLSSDKKEGEMTKLADRIFWKACKRFGTKKTVWVAHFRYLLKNQRYDEAHALVARSTQSLPAYKLVETMTKYAALEYEFGSPERGRTIYSSLYEKNPKRMDILFVHVDKEVKAGNMNNVRSIFRQFLGGNNNTNTTSRKKYSDKQVKSLFKKWYRVEEAHGDAASREKVKEAARSYVERTTHKSKE